MRLNDFLDVLRAEFGQAADDIDAALMAWMDSDPAEAGASADSLAGTLGRLATVARMVGLEGQALALEQLAATAQLTVFGDTAGLADTLGWLMGWRLALGPAFDQPGDAQAAGGVLDYFRQAPEPLAEPLLAELGELLCRPPAVPQEDESARAASFPEPEVADVSLRVPADADPALVEAFLDQAPDQLRVLGDAVGALAEGGCPTDRLAEAQRVAHTFKGSGNIIGIRGIGRLAHRLEDVLDFAQSRGGVLPPALAQDLLEAAGSLEQMIYALRGEEPEPPQALSHLRRLTDWARSIDNGTWELAGASFTDLPRAQDGAVPAGAAPDAAVSHDAGLVADLSGTVLPPVVAGAEPVETVAPAGPPGTATPGADPVPQQRVDAARLDSLTRRAGQQLVQNGRLADRLQRLDQRLSALLLAQQGLDTRLAELQAQIDRQGVNLHSRAQAAGQSFDALEMDRYNELHSLARLAAEMAADTLDLSRAARGDTREMANLLIEQEQGLKLQHAQLQDTRLVPFRQIAPRLQRNVTQTAAATGKRVRLDIEGEATMMDASVLEQLTEPLLHLLRNAVDHGIETAEVRERIGKPPQGTVTLQVQRIGHQLRVECRDDGRGLDLLAIHDKAIGLGLMDGSRIPDPQEVARLILLPGFSTRETVGDISGRGLGMDVVAQRVRAMKGRLDIHSEPFEGTRFTLELAGTTGIAHVLVVRAGGAVFALPSTAVVVAWPAVAVRREGERIVTDHGRWPARSLARAVGRIDGDAPPAGRPVVVVRSGRQELAFEVDAVIETRELVLQDVGRLLRETRGVAGGAIRANGQVVVLLEPDALDDPQAPIDPSAARALRERAHSRPRRALVVDDSHTVRRLLMQLLSDAGWEVRGARDGFDALAQLAQQPVDIVLTDLEMPQLNGLELTRHLKARPQGAQTPVLMITSRDTEKHRRSAAQAGVDHYLTKPYTDDDLLATVRALTAPPFADLASSSPATPAGPLASA